jgi:hypothetical protein
VGIATDDTTKDFFGSLATATELACLFGFENEEFVFPAYHAFRFALPTIDRSGSSSRRTSSSSRSAEDSAIKRALLVVESDLATSTPTRERVQPSARDATPI